MKFRPLPRRPATLAVLVGFMMHFLAIGLPAEIAVFVKGAGAVFFCTGLWLSRPKIRKDLNTRNRLVFSVLLLSPTVILASQLLLDGGWRATLVGIVWTIPAMIWAGAQIIKGLTTKSNTP